jgi:hypothetical protein
METGVGAVFGIRDAFPFALGVDLSGELVIIAATGGEQTLILK